LSNVGVLLFVCRSGTGRLFVLVISFRFCQPIRNWEFQISLAKTFRLQIAQGGIKIRHPKWQMYFVKVAAELIHA